jgi:hypothetical protein
VGLEQTRSRPDEGPDAVLETEQRLRDLAYRLCLGLAIEHHEIGGIADGNAVVLQVEQLRRMPMSPDRDIRRDRRCADLHHIGVEIDHADQRDIAERRERIQHVVGGDIGVDAERTELVRRGDAARHIVIVSRPVRNRSVAGNTVTATPASASRFAAASKSAGGIADSFVAWPMATRPPQPVASVMRQTSS